MEIQLIKDTIIKIENKIEKVKSEKNREELSELLTTLKSEVTKLSETQIDHAETITSFTHLSTHEATRKDKNQHLLNLSLEGLSSSVKGFESSHPKLVEIVNSICVMLSNIGI